MLDDLYARADEIMDGITPHALAVAKAEMHGLLAEAAMLGARVAEDRSTPPSAQLHRYSASVVVTCAGRRSTEHVVFVSRIGSLATERAADLEALRRFGSGSAPYVVRTSITRH